MGISALTRKGWKENPREQGKWNLAAAIFALIIVNLVGYIQDDRFVPIYYNIFILAWGVLSYSIGIIIDKFNKKQK